jgi:hypothetical protein
MYTRLSTQRVVSYHVKCYEPSEQHVLMMRYVSKITRADTLDVNE